MQTEFEAKFLEVEKDAMRKALAAAGAHLERPEFTQRRVVFHLPEGQRNAQSYIRVRDEGNRITMSLKQVLGTEIHDQKELMLKIDAFEPAVQLLELLGCTLKAFQETYRELWKLGDAEITIDEWPFLPPFVEVEAPTEAAVREAATRLGFAYEYAVFGAVDEIYARYYGVDHEVINNQTPRLAFGEPNPFAK